MMEKFKREYKFTTRIKYEPAIGVVIGLKNNQPKKRYMTAEWSFIFFIPFLMLEIELMYNYKIEGHDYNDIH